MRASEGLAGRKNQVFCQGGASAVIYSLRDITIDSVASRLEMAQEQGAEIIDYNKESQLDTQVA